LFFVVATGRVTLFAHLAVLAVVFAARIARTSARFAAFLGSNLLAENPNARPVCGVQLGVEHDLELTHAGGFVTNEFESSGPRSENFAALL
jgi:hypothetical protein